MSAAYRESVDIESSTDDATGHLPLWEPRSPFPSTAQRPWLSKHKISETLKRGARRTREFFTASLVNFDSWWWWEIFAMAFSITCTCLLVAMLLALDNKPLSTWHWKVAISPNAALSVLTTLGKTSMMVPVASCISQLKWIYFQQPRRLMHLQDFDNASRGPWGSMAFILTTRGGIATLGALVTVIALGYEPAAQQILSFPVQSAEFTNGTATIYQALEWATRKWDYLDALLTSVAGNSTNMAFDCPTHSCRFPDFTSLAVCSTCQDISNATQQQCHNCIYPAVDYSNCTCVYSPSDKSFEAMEVDFGNLYDLPCDGEVVSRPPTLTVKAAAGGDTLTWIAGMNVTMMNITAPLVLNMSSTPTSIPVCTFDLGYVQVYGCKMEFCSQTYSEVAVSDNGLKYSVVSTPLAQLKATESTTAEGYTSPLMVLFSNNLQNTQYLVEWESGTQLWGSLAQYLNGSSGDYSLGTNFDFDSGSNILTRFLVTQDFPNTLSIIANTVTNLMLSDLNNNVTQLIGQAFIDETFVRVHWPWLALPICLTAAAATLLIRSIVSSAKSKELLLKSSILAPLFHGLEGWPSDELQLTKREYSSSLEEMAKQMRANFSVNEAGTKKFMKTE